MEAIKLQADRVESVNTLSGLALMIAKKMIKVVGYYTYIDAETKEKVFVS